MWCAVITLFPNMFNAIQDEGICARALKKRLCELVLIDPREFAEDKYGTIDDRPYGGGPGMVMMAAPLRAAIAKAKAMAPKEAKVIYLSPSGKRFDNRMARKFVEEAQPLIFIAGRYEGIDQRVIERDVDEMLSVGDYVLSGGELAAMVVLDAMIRWLPGALGHELSVLHEAFSEENAGLLDCPHYTRPACLEGDKVPEVLLKGDHQAIAKWRKEQAMKQTQKYRPDLLENK
jgi:tRNA (guanine37-N1)-methyltransferase